MKIFHNVPTAEYAELLGSSTECYQIQRHYISVFDGEYVMEVPGISRSDQCTTFGLSRMRLENFRQGAEDYTLLMS